MQARLNIAMARKSRMKFNNFSLEERPQIRMLTTDLSDFSDINPILENNF